MIFTKYHGLGNDFVLAETRLNPGYDFQARAVEVCDRRRGVGADGLVSIAALGGCDFEMHIYNSDGSEAEMCGNATRCIADYIVKRALAPGREFTLHTLAGPVRPRVLDDGRVRVDMGEPRFHTAGVEIQACGRTFRGTKVSMGNPHFVIFVEDMDQIPIAVWGPELEVHSEFPQKCNIEFAQLIAPHHVRMRVWERGCGITAACGTGSCATAVACVLNQVSDTPLTVTLDGGDLEIDYAPGKHIFMTGPATEVFSGETVHPAKP